MAAILVAVAVAVAVAAAAAGFGNERVFAVADVAVAHPGDAYLDLKSGAVDVADLAAAARNIPAVENAVDAAAAAAVAIVDSSVAVAEVDAAVAIAVAAGNFVDIPQKLEETELRQ